MLYTYQYLFYVRSRFWFATPILEVLYLTYIILTLNLILSKLSFLLIYILYVLK